MFNVSTIGHTTHIKPIVQFLPNASKHCIVNGCNSFCYSCLQLIRVSRNRGQINQSFHKSLKKKSHSVSSEWPGHEIVIIMPRLSNPFVCQFYVQKLSNPEAPMRWRSILSPDSFSLNSSINQFSSMSKYL